MKTTALAALAVIMAGCSNSYPGETLDIITDPSVFNTETAGASSSNQPVKVFINEQDFFTVSATRGHGPFERDVNRANRFWNSYFHIFAFRKGKYTQANVPELTEKADLTMSAYAKNAPAGKTDVGRVNCLMDSYDYSLGVPMQLNYSGTGELKYYLHDQNQGELLDLDTPTDWAHLRDSIFYYNAQYQDVPYDFFAYYIDDFTPTAANTHRLSDRIYYDLKIDGSQDIMCGKAPALDSMMVDWLRNPDNYSKQSPLVELYKNNRQDWDRVLNIGGYCAYAAHRGIDPQVKMTHQLARLEFYAHPGDRTCDSITITGIEVVAPNEGQFIVASNDPKNIPVGITWDTSKMGSMHLTEATQDGKQKCQPLKGYVVKYDEAEENLHWTQRKETRIGGSLLVRPAKNYKLILHFKQKMPLTYTGKVSEQTFDAEYTIQLNDNVGGIFKPGFKYPVHIGVYGLEEIKVTTWVQGWEDAGNVVKPIDPDDQVIPTEE